MMEKIAEQQANLSVKKVKSQFWMIGIVSLVLLLVEMITPPTASAWNGGAHRFIASQGILILKNDYPIDVEYLYDPVYINGKPTNGANLLMYYATEPDDNPLENDGGARIGGFRGHFYDPSTGLNYRGERNPTANTRLSWHYGNAVKAYKNGDRVKGWIELGRAIHYLGDLNAPHHAANMPNFDPKVYWTPAPDWLPNLISLRKG